MSRNNHSTMLRAGNRKSFTLIELLVVLALVAILSVVVILTLNPAELLKQARDSNRLSDLSTINTALNLFSADVTSGFMGTSTVVYVSIPDNASSTCGSLGLPTLPIGYTYNCVTTANLRNTNGTGWIPVNFQRISSNSPISQLPIDPVNATSTRLYYTYVTGGSWKLNTKLESQKQIETVAGTDGGVDPGSFETGNNLTLAPFTSGLVGWWKFDEGSGATAVDSSGYANDGIWNGTSTLRYVVGKVGQYAGYFNGSSDYFSISDGLNFSVTSTRPISISGWLNVFSIVQRGAVVGHAGWDYTLYYGDTAGIGVWTSGGASVTDVGYNGVQNNSWVMVSGVVDSISRITSLYINGVLVNSASFYQGLFPGYYPNTPLTVGKDPHGWYMGGYLDDIRVYNRALSATEVLALYNATK